MGLSVVIGFGFQSRAGDLQFINATNSPLPTSVQVRGGSLGKLMISRWNVELQRVSPVLPEEKQVAY